jgi:hypothetical protein
MAGRYSPCRCGFYSKGGTAHEPSNLFIVTGKGEDLAQWPADFRVQDFPR